MSLSEVLWVLGIISFLVAIERTSCCFCYYYNYPNLLLNSGKLPDPFVFISLSESLNYFISITWVLDYIFSLGYSTTTSCPDYWGADCY